MHSGRLALWLGAWIVLPGALAQAPAGAPPSVVLAALSFPADATVEFVQRQLNPMLRRVFEQRGSLVKAADGSLRMLVTMPREEERVIRNGVVELRRAVPAQKGPQRRQMLSRVLDPDKAQELALLAMEALLQGDLDFVAARFEMRSLPVEEGWGIALLPRGAAVQEELDRVLLYGHGRRLERFRTERDDGPRGAGAWLEIEILPDARDA